MDDNISKSSWMEKSSSEKIMPYSFSDIIDIPTVQAMVDGLVKTKPIPITIIDRDGPVLITAGEQDICSQLHCNQPQAEVLCPMAVFCHRKQNHPLISVKPAGKYSESTCKNGMIDIAVPIVVKGNYLATLFLGHFFLESLDENLFHLQAEKYGFKIEEYLTAIQKIPAFSRRQLTEILDFYLRFVEFLTRTGEQRLLLLQECQKTQRSAEKFRSFFENSNDGIYIFAKNGRILEVNQTACRQTGFCSEELLQKKMLDLWAAEEAVPFEKLVREVKKKKKLIFDKIYHRQDGSTFPGENNACPFTYRGTSAFLCSCRDITFRKRVEKELKSAHQNLQDIIDFLPDATFVIDRQGKVVAWNRAIEQMTGVKAEDMLGKGDFAYARPFYGKQRPILIDLVEGRNPQLKVHYDFKVTDKNILHAEAYVASAYGNKGAYLSGIAAPLLDHDGNHVGAIESIRDISEQKQVEETLRQQTRLLEETNTALKVLLRESAAAKEELERKVLANVKELVLPYINDLNGLLTDKPQKVYLETITTNLHEITSSFSRQLSAKYLDLTPREIQIADFIRQGKTNKEMAYLLKTSISAIDFHRRNLREKFNIKGKKTNLRSFLLAHLG